MRNAMAAAAAVKKIYIELNGIELRTESRVSIAVLAIISKFVDWPKN
jgi:hypothetical protein